MSYSVLDVQRKLNSLGFAPGPLDGVRGKRTIMAIQRFQTQHGLRVDGIAGPNTIAALFSISLTKAQGPDSWPWLTEGLRTLGWEEVDDNAKLMRWLKSDGHGVNPAHIPWCADWMETCILRTLPAEPVPSVAHWARSWIGFGIYTKPRIAAIMVFERGPDSGHIGQYVGEDRTHYHILGGNQNQRVSRARVAKRRLLSSRWPSTVPLNNASNTRLIITGGDIAETTNEE